MRSMEAQRAEGGLPAPGDAPLAMRVLGPFELSGGDKSLVRLPKKAQALLAILALSRGQPLPKERLATLLWGDSLTEQARQSLRQCLVTIRKALGEHGRDLLVADAATIRLTAPGALRVDADDFLARLGSEEQGELEVAHALYRDEVLAGLAIPVEPFERWVAIERQRFGSMRLELLHRLAAGRARDGQVEKAVAAARLLVDLDPMQEEGHRLLMRLLAAAGNRGGALVQYEQCVRTLRDELGIAPDAETTALAEAIRSGAPIDTAFPSARVEANGAGATTLPGATGADAGAGAPARPDKPSIVVLPFANLSGDPAQDYFVSGLVEDLTVALGREKWLFVIASPTAFALEEDAFDPRAVAARLGVRYVLRGSVRVDAGEVLFVVRLSDALRGAQVWSGRFKDRIDNLFALQDRLTTRVAATIAPALMSSEVERALHKPTESLTAFDLYLRAVPRFRVSREENGEALRLLGEAIRLDPSYAAACALAARCYQFQLMFHWRPPGDPGFEEGVRLAHLAAGKGQNDPEALWMAGLALAHLSGEVDYSLSLIERALALNPNSANAWTASCLVRSYLGDSEAAIEHFNQAQRLNPLDLSQHLHWNTVAWAYLGVGRYREAADAADRTLGVQPDYLPGLRLAACTHALLGEIEQSRAVVRRLLARQPTCTLAWMRAFLEKPLSRNRNALDAYLEGARLAGVPERPTLQPGRDSDSR